VKILVPQTPGGASDALARIMAQKLSEKWGQPVVVENRAGAGGNVGMEVVANSPADGYTLWLGTDGPLAINKSLYKNVPYDPITAFAPLSLLARYQLVLVTDPALNTKTVAQFVEAARKKPDGLTFGSPGIGSQHHLAMETLQTMTGTRMLHVPYKGSAAALTAQLAGEIQAQFIGTAVVQQHIQKGSVTALGVSSKVRSPVLPDLPTVAEGGVAGFDISAWFGLLAPGGTPRPIVDKLHAELLAIVALPDVREKMLSQGLETVTSTPEEFAQLIKSDIGKWAKIVSDAKLPPQ
jgi:tripartite-type tricarboxylate transporter receptor subunit TctC